MEVRRTAPVKLVVPDSRRGDLHESAQQFLYCANHTAEFCWSDRSYIECVTANTTARDALYDELREETDLTETSFKKPFDVTSKPSQAVLSDGKTESE